GALRRAAGAHRIAAGLIVRAAVPPPLRRRGEAARRAKELADIPGIPNPAGEVRRRGAVRRSHLIASGVLRPDAPYPPSVLALGDWLVEPATWRCWADGLREAADRWAAANPMSPGMPREAAVREVGLPDGRLLDALIAEGSDLVSDAGGVHRPQAAPRFPPAVDAALQTVRECLAADA